MGGHRRRRLDRGSLGPYRLGPAREARGPSGLRQSGKPAVSADLAPVWSKVIGQPRATALLEAAIAAPVHAYLFVGPRGAGKRAAAAIFAGELLARAVRGGDGARHRRLAFNEQHPDL